MILPLSLCLLLIVRVSQAMPASMAGTMAMGDAQCSLFCCTKFNAQALYGCMQNVMVTCELDSTCHCYSTVSAGADTMSKVQAAQWTMDPLIVKEMLTRDLVCAGWSSQQLLQPGAAGEWELGSGIWGLQVTGGQPAEYSWTCGRLLEER